MNSYSLLHIEDNITHAFIVKKTLEKTGDKYDITHKQTLESALQYLNQSKDYPDVIILDYKLPDSDGIDSVNKLLSIKEELCIVVLTSHDETELGKQTVNAGAQDFIMKSNLSPELLHKSITFSLNRQRLLTEVKQKNRELNHIYNSVQSKIFKISSAGSHLIYNTANRPFAVDVGLITNNIAGKKVKEVIGEATYRRLKNKITEAYYLGDSVKWSERTTYFGEEKVETVKVTPFYKNGKLDYVLGTIYDITEIANSKKMVERNEKFLTAIFRNTINALFVADDEGNYLMTNEGAEKLLGYSKEDFRRKKVSDLKSPEGVNLFEQYQKFIRKGEQSGEVTFVTKENKVKTAIFQATRVKKDFNISVMIDISERVKYQKEVDKLSFVAKNTINGTVLTDKEGRTIWVNDAYQKITGYGLKEIVGRKPGKYLQGPKSDTDTISKMTSAIKNQKPFEETILNYRKDGSPFWFKIECQPLFKNGEFDGYFSIQTDVTDEIESKKALQLTNDQLRLALNAGNLLVFEWDINTNQLFQGLTGDSITGNNSYSTECLDTLIELFVHKDDKSAIYSLKDRVKSNLLSQISHKLRLTIDGEVKWIEVHGKVFYDNDNPVKLHGVVRDVSEQIETEKRILNASVTALENERERLSKDIHDGLQQTLLVSQLNIDAVRNKQTLHAESEIKLNNAFDYIKKAIRECKSLAYDLFPKELSDFGYSIAVQNIIEKIDSDIHFYFFENLRNERLSKNLELGLFRITQECTNNILKHSQATEAHIQCVRSGDKVNLSIEDDGVGISYYQKPVGSGFNSIRSRVASLGGNLEIDSKPKKGTTIMCEFDLK